VDGVRRVWGTMRGCSYRTVLSTLQRLTTVAEKVEVRRKFKKRGSIEVRWWFLIRGEQSVLQTLDQEWMNVENSTSWKLEHCYQPVSPSATDNLMVKEMILRPQCPQLPVKRTVRVLFCPFINCKLLCAGCLL